MKYLWKSSKKLGDKYGINEIRLFMVTTIVCCACLCLLIYAIIACVVGPQMKGMTGAGGVSTVLVGIVIGLFGSVLWMIRNEEEM